MQQLERGGATQALTRLTLESEPELRTMLRHSLEPDTGHDGQLLVWLTDIAGLSRDEAVELMRWSARALLQSSLSNVPAGSSESQQ